MRTSNTHQPTAVQMSHRELAAKDRSQFASVNHGKPAVAATAKPGDFKAPVLCLRRQQLLTRAQQVKEQQVRVHGKRGRREGNGRSRWGKSPDTSARSTAQPNEIAAAANEHKGNKLWSEAEDAEYRRDF